VRYIDVELVPESRRSGVKSRASTLLSAKCVAEGEIEQGVRIRNLSDTGLGGVCVSGLGFTRGQALTVWLRDTSWIKGRVVWADGRRFGVIFDRPIDVASFNSAAKWNGPEFEVAALHAPVKRTWRPALAAK
jgi:PilZ domain